MKLVFATHNRYKIREVRALLPKSISLHSLDEIGCTEEIIENGNSLEENARIKAAHVKEKYGFDCFADDTGLEIVALNGAPGIYSARYAGLQCDSKANMLKVLEALENTKHRVARFRTVIALYTSKEEIIFEGTLEGIITENQRGSHGFGYDPIFEPFNYDVTLAEIPMGVKSQISHRAKAIKKLAQHIRLTYGKKR